MSRSAATNTVFRSSPTHSKRRLAAVAVGLAAAVTLLTPDCPAQAAVGYMCSAGSNDGGECDFDSDCPNGACLAAQAVCDSGDSDGAFCDCPGGSCVSGICRSGAYNGETCDTANNCDGGVCKFTQKVCAEGLNQGYACTINSHCPDSICIANGRLCHGGPYFQFGCVEDDSCIKEGEPGGICRTPADPVSAPYLCSAGSKDGQECDEDVDCPSGACVYPWTVCDGGETRSGAYCESDTDCDPNNPCAATQRICTAGGSRGVGCTRTSQCSSGECLSTGLYCNGGDFDLYSCIDDQDCGSGGECFSPAGIPTPTTRPGGNATSTRRPTPIPTRTKTRAAGLPTLTPTRSNTWGVIVRKEGGCSSGAGGSGFIPLLPVAAWLLARYLFMLRPSTARGTCSSKHQPVGFQQPPSAG